MEMPIDKKLTKLFSSKQMEALADTRPRAGPTTCRLAGISSRRQGDRTNMNATLRLAFAIGLSVLTIDGNIRSAHADDPVTADVLLQGGTIVDGSGTPRFIGDVAIKNDRIVGVGQFAVSAADLTIDCRGLVIAPGFIDLHNHSDRQIVVPATRACMNYVLQGCTTIVTGNCGSGPIDVGRYYERIDSAGAGTNVIHLLPQGNLRETVIGNAQRSATPDELSEMRTLAEKAMQDGAWGMSTGLIYVPSTYADTDELVTIAEIVSRHQGIYASHIRNESTEVLAAVNEALEIGRRANLPVHISHFKSSGQDAWGLVRRAAELIEAARQEGRRATADQYPYIASSTSLGATLIPTASRSGSRRDLIARFDDPVQSKKLRAAMQKNLDKRDGGATIRIARYAPRKDWVGKNLAEIASGEEKSALEIAEEISRHGGASIVNFSMSEDDVRHIMALPWVATASDGRAYVPGPDRPHPRSYGTFPRKIGYYALKEQVISLEHAVRSSSGLPAEILGLSDRGVLKEGTFADVAVFDPAGLVDAATFDAPHQYSRGLRYVFINGQASVYDGSPTGALNGKSLRHTPATEVEKSE